MIVLWTEKHTFLAYYLVKPNLSLHKRKGGHIKQQTCPQLFAARVEPVFPSLNKGGGGTAEVGIGAFNVG
jgi:hypothetical protein